MHRRCLENAISVWATDNYKQITIRMTPFVWNEFFHHRGFANPVFQQLRLLSPPWLLPGLAFAQGVFGNAISVWAIENYKQIIIRMAHFVWNVFFTPALLQTQCFSKCGFFRPLALACLAAWRAAAMCGQVVKHWGPPHVLPSWSRQGVWSSVGFRLVLHVARLCGWPLPGHFATTLGRPIL